MTERTVEAHKLQDFLITIKTTINGKYGYNTYPVLAEISGLKFKAPNYYMQLIDTDSSGVTVSEIGGVIWSDELTGINAKLNIARIQLDNGLKTIFYIQVQYHIKFGLRLKIVDLDVNFVKGAIEVKKEEIRNRLTTENLINKNKSLPVPFLIKSIVVIGSKTSAGIKDFFGILKRNRDKVNYEINFLDSTIQGAYAKRDLLKHLATVDGDGNNYDAVFLLRGGGSATDLDNLNDYDLCVAVCNCRCPVFVGIGHLVDSVLIDEVAHHSAITPTDLANFIDKLALQRLRDIEQFQTRIFDTAKATLKESNTGLGQNIHKVINVKYTVNELSHSLDKQKQEIFQTARDNTTELRHGINKHKNVVVNTKSELLVIESDVSKLQNKIMTTAELMVKYRDIDTNYYLSGINEKPKALIEKVSQKVNSVSDSVLYKSRASIQRADHKLDSVRGTVIYKTKESIKNTAREFENLETQIDDRNPENLFKRGYSMTLLNGKGVKDVSNLSAGAEVTTVLKNGKFKSTITEITKGENNGL